MKGAVKPPEPIARATAKYEKWLRRQIPLIEADLRIKHQKMTVSPFQFLRATHYRWAQIFPAALPEINAARRVLAVGDLHVENFGTWRDEEGRLVWGVNDFDDGAELPYTYDLVRLATSVVLARKASHASFGKGDCCQRVLDGYRDSLRAGGSPCVIGEDWQSLVPAIEAGRISSGAFWQSLERLPIAKPALPAKAREMLVESLPGTQNLRLARRVAGLGGLGRERFVGLATWHGARVAREIKRLAPPAHAWLGAQRDEVSNVKRLIARAVRSPDPMLRVRGQWIVRRLALDSGKIEFASLPQGLDVTEMLYAMGWEVANIHLGSASAASLLKDLRRSRRGWLAAAAAEMAKLTERDWKAWRAETRNRKKGHE